LAGSENRGANLDNVVILADRLIGEGGRVFSYAMRTLDHTRITIAALSSKAYSSCSPTWA
jgi:alkylation response protein AidB-like acyl-CoA dehydrogenase